MHIGHIEIVDELLKCKMFDEIIIIPSYIPPHKECTELLNDNVRFEICKKVFADLKGVFISDIEIKRKGKSYTLDTLNELKKENPQSRFFVTVGGDMIMSLNTWYKFDELKKGCTFVAFNRAGIEARQFNKQIAFLKENGADIIVINKRISDISSTLIREKVKKGEDLSGLLPKAVIEYIDKNGYYR